MRAFVIAAVAALGFAAMAAPASARPWNDPQGRLTFEAPSGWTVEQSNCPECTLVLMFSSSRDCHIYARPREVANRIQPQRVRSFMRDPTRITQELLTNGANALTSVFPGDSAQFVSQSLDEAGFWPVARAEYRNAEGKSVYGAFTLRQDMEIWALCLAAGGTDAASNYDAILRSIGTPNDATLQAEVEAAEAANPTTPAPAAAPAQ